MKINIDRLCQLAGVPAGGTTRRRSGMLSEASNRSLHDDPHVADEAEFRYGSNQLSETYGEGHHDNYEGAMHAEDMDEDMDEYMHETMEEDPDEVIEISEAELVQELRRAKRMMRETRSKQAAELKEARQIQSLVDQEVAAMMKEYNLTADWVYGNNKPTFSKKGQVTTMIPGIGFGKRR